MCTLNVMELLQTIKEYQKRLIFGVLVQLSGSFLNSCEMLEHLSYEFQLDFFCRIKYLMKQGIRNLIFTSGTLSPLKPLISEMELPNPIQLINPHIIADSQILVRIVANGPDNVQLNSCYRNR